MKQYIITQDIGFTRFDFLVFNDAKPGELSVGSLLPLLSSEAELFAQMEKFSVTKYSENGKYFEIREV